MVFKNKTPPRKATKDLQAHAILVLNIQLQLKVQKSEK